MATYCHCSGSRIIFWVLFLIIQSSFIIKDSWLSVHGVNESFNFVTDQTFTAYSNNETCDVTELQKWRRCQMRRKMMSSMTFAPVGRTGNRIHEYASVIGLAVKHGMLPTLPNNTGLETCFQIEKDAQISATGSSYIHMHPADLHYEGLVMSEHRAHGKSIMMDSLMQSWKYFGHVDEMVRNVFKFRENHKISAETFLRSSSSNMTADMFINVCVQVRRTDFVNTYRHLIKPISLSYIHEAMTRYRKVFRHLVRFVIVSDDTNWCREHIKISKHDIISEGHEPCIDLAILSQCNHSIISSGSSFGWWGAFLANGHVTYYPGWLKTGSWYNLKYSEEDFFLPRWTKIT